jgi:hypothetical protein
MGFLKGYKILQLFLPKFVGKLQNLGGRQQNFMDLSQNFEPFSIFLIEF